MNSRALGDLGGGVIGGLLAARAHSNPDKTAVVCAGASRTYSQLDNAASVVGSALSDLVDGVPNAAVGICLSNRIEFIETWMGTARAGLVQVPINTAYKRTFLEHALAHTSVQVLVTESSLIPVLEDLAEIPAALEVIVVVDQDSPSPVGGVRAIGWDELLASGDAGRRFRPVGPSDITSIQLTSGTTGRSKGVVMPHLHNVIGAREGAVAMETTASDRVYTCLPLFHGAAQINIFLRALYAGATSIIAPRFSASRFWDEIREHRATEFNALGSILPVLLSMPPSEQDREHEVDRVFAAPAQPDVLYRFEERFGVHVVEGYGSSEIKNVTYNPIRNRRVGSIGKPTPSTILEVHDEAGGAAAPGVVGEIVYRPKMPSIMLVEYHNDPAATMASSRDLWWHTGDLGYMDSDGYFYFVDRKKDALRRRGENISSFEVESILAAFPGVVEAAAVARPSELGEDEVLAVVQVHDRESFDLPKLFAHCDRLMPHFMVPRFYRVVESMPRTPTGKIRKVELRDDLDGGVWDAHSDGLAPTRQS